MIQGIGIGYTEYEKAPGKRNYIQRIGIRYRE